MSFFDPNTVLYPSRDVLFYSADVHSNHIERQRMDILKKIVEGKPLTIVACLDVFMEKMIPFEEFKEHCLTIDFESIIDTAPYSDQKNSNPDTAPSPSLLYTSIQTDKENPPPNLE